MRSRRTPRRKSKRFGVAFGSFVRAAPSDVRGGGPLFFRLRRRLRGVGGWAFRRARGSAEMCSNRTGLRWRASHIAPIPLSAPVAPRHSLRTTLMVSQRQWAALDNAIAARQSQSQIRSQRRVLTQRAHLPSCPRQRQRRVVPLRRGHSPLLSKVHRGCFVDAACVGSPRGCPPFRRLGPHNRTDRFLEACAVRSLRPPQRLAPRQR